MMKVLRLNAEELAAEEHNKGKHKGSAMQASAVRSIICHAPEVARKTIDVCTRRFAL